MNLTGDQPLEAGHCPSELRTAIRRWSGRLPGRPLPRTSLAPALFGSVLGIVGLVVLAAEALPHVATGSRLEGEIQGGSPTDSL
jgi:hypothetical protein